MQSRNQSIIVRLTAVMVAIMSLATLSGCGVSKDAPPTNYNAPVELAGLVLAGRNYVQYATIKIYATQPTGVANANGTYVGTAKLLGTAKTSVTGTWTVDNLTCSSPDQLYVTAEGGTPFPYLNNFTSLSNNPNSLMMTAVGDCATLTNEDNPRNTTQIITNEASSVAAVWALRPFISISGTTVNVTSSATNYAGTSGTGVIGNYAGLAHGFLNANNLNNFREGAFNSYTNGANSVTTGGLVTVQTLDTLAFMQYLCTIGAPDGATAGNFTLCSSTSTTSPGLFQLATPPGGTAPTNSLQAMLNIANYPTNNAAGLMTFAQSLIPGAPTGQQNYGTSTAQPGAKDGIGPFIPALTSFCSTTCPTQDYTVGIYYGPGFIGASANPATNQASATIQFVSLDANDNVYFSNPNASTSTQGNIISLTSSGAFRWASATDFSIDTQPRGNVPDQFGNLWVASGGTTTGQNVVVQMNKDTGTVTSTYPTTNTPLYGITVDSLGNVWYTDAVATGTNLHELVKSNNYAESSFTAAGQTLGQVRADANNNIWAAGSTAFTYLPNTGTAASPSYPTTLVQGALPAAAGTGIAVDKAGNAYMTTNAPATAAAGALYYAVVNNPGASASLSTTSVGAVPSYASVAFTGRFMDTDGAGNILFSDYNTTSYFYTYFPQSASGIAYYPCYLGVTSAGGGSPGPGANVCGTGASYRLDQALDSTGSLWVASYGNAAGGRMMQVISPAAPTVPLNALGKIGVMP